MSGLTGSGSDAPRAGSRKCGDARRRHAHLVLAEEAAPALLRRLGLAQRLGAQQVLAGRRASRARHARLLGRRAEVAAVAAHALRTTDASRLGRVATAGHRTLLRCYAATMLLLTPEDFRNEGCCDVAALDNRPLPTRSSCLAATDQTSSDKTVHG